MYRLVVRTHFDAAHYIAYYAGKCQREHGHRWGVVVHLTGDRLDELNMLVDFVQAKDVINDVTAQWLDHYQLNDSLGEPNMTAEYLARWLYEQLNGRIIGPVIVASVEIWESPDCGVIYSV